VWFNACRQRLEARIAVLQAENHTLAAAAAGRDGDAAETLHALVKTMTRWRERVVEQRVVSVSVLRTAQLSQIGRPLTHLEEAGGGWAMGTRAVLLLLSRLQSREVALSSWQWGSQRDARLTEDGALQQLHDAELEPLRKKLTDLATLLHDRARNNPASPVGGR
jgi:hypothetical protein